MITLDSDAPTHELVKVPISKFDDGYQEHKDTR